MKTKLQKGLVRFSGLFGLSLLMVAAGAQAAHAAVIEGTGSGSGSVHLVASTSYAMTAWIAGAAVAALVIVGIVVWGLARRRQRLGRLAIVTNSAPLTNASAVRQLGSVTSIAPTAEASAAQQSDEQADSQRKAA